MSVARADADKLIAERTSNERWNDWVFPLPTGSQPAGASPYGVLDMVGNADEYVERDDGDSSFEWV